MCRPWNSKILPLIFTLFYCFFPFIVHSLGYRPSKASHVRAYNGHGEIIAPIDLFHNGGLLVYSFICMISSLSDLVWKWEFVCILHMKVRKANYHSYKRIYLKRYIEKRRSSTSVRFVSLLFYILQTVLILTFSNQFPFQTRGYTACKFCPCAITISCVKCWVFRFKT